MVDLKIAVWKLFKSEEIGYVSCIVLEAVFFMKPAFEILHFEC